MAISTYAELQTAIANWLDRSDLTSRIPEFIVLAEAEFNRTIRVDQMVQRSTIDTDQQYTQLPSDFREMLNVQLNVTAPKDLDFYAPQQADKIRKQYYRSSGEPVAYSLLANGLELIPTPDATYELEIAYYKAIPALAAALNWLLTRHPDLYLYGSLVHSAPFLREDERVPLWVAARDQILESIRLENERAMFSGSALRTTIAAIG